MNRRPGEREEAETYPMVDGREDLFFVLELVDRDQAFRRDQVAEELGGGGVGGDAGRQDHAGAALRGDERAARFGEDRVGVDVTLAGSCEAPGLAQQLAD